MLHVLATRAIRAQASGGPYGFGRLRLPEFLDIQHMKLLGLSVLSAARLYPQIELTPGPQCGWKYEANENSQRPHRESNPRRVQADYSENS
jgi:hypothetical protein